MRASSSLETTGNYSVPTFDRNVTSSLAERISPYTGLSDVASLINNPSTIAAIAEAVASSSGVTPAPPLTTNLRAGKSSTGSLLDQVTNRTVSRGPVISMPNSRPHSPHTSAGFTNTLLSRSGVTSGNSQYKTLKEQLKDELKSAVEERRALMDGYVSSPGISTSKSRSGHMKDAIHRRSENDLQALFDIYSNVTDLNTNNNSLSRSGNRSRNYTLSDSALARYSPLQDDLPPGYYKSHGYDASTIPAYSSVLDELDSTLRRPYSSLNRMSGGASSSIGRYNRGSHAMATAGLGHMDLSLMDPDLDGKHCICSLWGFFSFIHSSLVIPGPIST